MSAFGSALAAALDRAGMTETELAEALGCDNTTVSHWVIGDRNPSTAVLERVLAVFPGLPRPAVTYPDRGSRWEGLTPGAWSGSRSGPCPVGAEGRHVWWVSRSKAVRVCDMCPCVEVRT